MSRSYDLLSSQNTPGQERGISCSLIKNDTTVTTDSVNEERRVLIQTMLSQQAIQDGMESVDNRNNILQLGESLEDEGEDAVFRGDTTAPLLQRYEEYFRSEDEKSQGLPYHDQQTYCVAP